MDVPLYLATAEANQPGNPQGEPTDRTDNLSPENENANKNSHNFYAGAELEWL